MAITKISKRLTGNSSLSTLLGSIVRSSKEVSVGETGIGIPTEPAGIFEQIQKFDHGINGKTASVGDLAVSGGNGRHRTEVRRSAAIFVSGKGEQHGVKDPGTRNQSSIENNVRRQGNIFSLSAHRKLFYQSRTDNARYGILTIKIQVGSGVGAVKITRAYSTGTDITRE